MVVFPLVMKLTLWSAIGLASSTTLVQAGRVQLPGLTVPPNAVLDRASVVLIFNESYNAYRCVRWISSH